MLISGWNKCHTTAQSFASAEPPLQAPAHPAQLLEKATSATLEDEKSAIIEKDFTNTVLSNKCTVNLSVPLREMKKAQKHITASLLLSDKARAISAKCHPYRLLLRQWRKKNKQTLSLFTAVIAIVPGWSENTDRNLNTSRGGTEHQGLFPCSNALVQIQRLK